MDYRDYYKILEVERKASADEIKSSFRKLARKYHPDLNQGNKEQESRFKEVNEAYEVLSDPEKRQQYDQLGPDWQERVKARAGAGNGNGGFHSGPFGQDDVFSDFFQSIFGGTRGAGFDGFAGGRQAAPGPDYRSELTLTLEDLYKGTTRLLNINNEKLQVQIPRGFPADGVLRFAGKGGEGPGGRGNLYLKVKCASHGIFKRKDERLDCDLILDLYTALLGGEVELTTLKGNINLKIQPGTQNDQVLRLKELGMPIQGAEDKFGDLFVNLKVKLPETLSEEERETFQKLRDSAASPG